MGLPVSFLQQRYDTYWDMKFGSSKMYLFRGQMNFLAFTATSTCVNRRALRSSMEKLRRLGPCEADAACGPGDMG